jgi:mRNA interferase RelE/StbE
MAWRLEYTESARQDLRNLDHAIAQQVLRKIHAIRNDPLRSMKRLKGSSDWRLRVGDWRVVVRVDAASELATVQRIGHPQRRL